MAPTRRKKMRTNITLLGEDVELLNKIKKLIANKLETKKIMSSADIVRLALEKLEDNLSRN